MAGSLVAFGTEPAVAAVTTIAYRLLAYWLPLLVAAGPTAVILRRAWPARSELRAG